MNAGVREAEQDERISMCGCEREVCGVGWVGVRVEAPGVDPGVVGGCWSEMVGMASSYMVTYFDCLSRPERSKPPPRRTL